jgi:hypothetical protein
MEMAVQEKEDVVGVEAKGVEEAVSVVEEGVKAVVAEVDKVILSEGHSRGGDERRGGRGDRGGKLATLRWGLAVLSVHLT